MESASPQTLLQRLFTVTMIWASLTTSPGIYALVLYVMSQNGGLPPVGDTGMDEATLRYVLILMGAAMGGGALTLPGMLLKPATIRERLREQGVEPVNLTGEELALALIPFYTTFGLIRWGMGETIGVFGVFAGMALGMGPICYGLLIASAALLTMMKPSRAELDALGSAVRGM